MGGEITLVQLIQHTVAAILFFVIFFGISFILNMLLRRTWFMSFVYPVVVLLIVDNIPMKDYFTNPVQALSTAFTNLFNITLVDMVILLSGFLGTIVSAVVIKALRNRGYQMF